MENQGNTQHCAMVAKGGKCCDGMAMNAMGCRATGFVFGVLVLVGLAVVITMQSKILKQLQKSGKKK